MLDKKTVTLRTVAERVGLAPCSASAVLNNTPASWAIPQRTKDRVFRAAAHLNYRPNLSARSLRTKRTHMIAVLADFGQAPAARVVASMQRSLHRRGYLLILAASDGAAGWNRTSVELQQRGIEGVIAVGANLPREVDLPVVAVDIDYWPAREALGDEASAWLSELGESAVEEVLRMVETKAAPRKTTLVPKFPPAFVDLSSFNLPGARLGLQGDVRDAP